MALRLTIENMPSLPDGGPISFTLTGKRSIDIGRDQHLDWTLPDPTRYISGKHCEIHCKGNSYWLQDVSTNGTFVNGSDQRVRSPYELRSGDRLVIGHYLIAVAVEAEGQSPHPSSQALSNGIPSQQHAAYPELWSSDQEAPPPVERNQVVAPWEASRPINPDFLDWAAGVPEVDAPRIVRSGSSAKAVEPEAGMDWASGSVARLDPKPPSPVAAPRRPIWKEEGRSESDGNPFGAPQAAAPLPSFAEENPARKKPLAEPPQSSGVATEIARSDLQPAGQNFVRRIARAAALPEDFFAGKDTDQLADQLGELMRISVTNVMSLLQARNEAKRLTRSTNHTTIQATENNPLKFSPSPEDAMRILFGPKTHSYMEAHKAFEQGFGDLKLHQLKTYAAMQHAVSMLIAELDPAAIIKDLETHETALDKLRSRKSRLWDAFVTRWKASLGREPGAAIQAFMLHFADRYDQDSRYKS